MEKMSCKKRKASRAYLSLYKTKFFRKSREEFRIKKSQSSESSTTYIYGNEDNCNFKSFCVKSVQTEMDIRCAKTQTENKIYKTSYSQTESIQCMCSTDFWNSFQCYLSRNGQLKDFQSLAEGLLAERIDCRNMSWLSCLHLGRYSQCKSTTGMRFDSEYMEFMSLLYLLYGSSMLNVLCRSTNFGSVVSGKCMKSCYSPMTTTVNFPVPDVRTLRNLDSGYTKHTVPGLLNNTLNICEEKAKQGNQYCISFDGMRVSSGTKGVSHGDVNLWGIEKPMSSSKCQQMLETDLSLVQDIQRSVTEINTNVQILKYERLLLRLTKRLEQLRNRMTGSFLLEQKLEKMKVRNPDRSDSFEYSLKFIYKNVIEMENCCDRGLSSNLDICRVLAELHGSSCCVPHTMFVQLHTQPNYFHLLPYEYVKHNIDFRKEENTVYCEKRSSLWYRLHKEAMVTDSTLYTALGFNTLKKEREHFNVFVKKCPAPDVQDDIWKSLNFEVEHEIHAISTIVGLLLPALKPSCFSFYKVGPKFIHGRNRKNFMEVTANGIIVCTLEDTCPNKEIGKSHRRIGVAIKSLCQIDQQPNFPNYQLLLQDVPQVLCIMSAYNCDELWLITYTVKCVTVVSVQFNDSLWEQLENLTKEKYDCVKPVYPTRIHSACKELRTTMNEFISNHTRLICEVPSF